MYIGLIFESMVQDIEKVPEKQREGMQRKFCTTRERRQKEENV
jgi:hypothetical protein